MKYLPVLALLTLILSGCWSYKEISGTSFISIMALDLKGQNFLLTANVLVSKGGGGTGNSDSGSMKSSEGSVWTIRAEAQTLNEAYELLQRISPRRLSLGHLRALYIGESLARSGIKPVLSYFTRLSDVRPTVWVGVTPGMASQLLEARPALEPYPSNGPMGYHDLIRGLTSLSPARRVITVIAILTEKGNDVVLPVFRLVEPGGNPAEVVVDSKQGQEEVYGGGALFADDRLVEWLKPEVTRGLLLARGEAVKASIPAPCPRSTQHAVFRLRKNSSAITVQRRGRAAVAEIRLKVTADIIEAECVRGPLNESAMNEFRTALAGQIRRLVEQVVEISRETGADPIGLGQTLFRRNPSDFRALEPSWQKILAEMPVKVTVKVNVPRTGQLYDVIQGDQNDE